jgi:hypothetical protein
MNKISADNDEVDRNKQSSGRFFVLSLSSRYTIEKEGNFVTAGLYCDSRKFSRIIEKSLNSWIFSAWKADILFFTLPLQNVITYINPSL